MLCMASGCGLILDLSPAEHDRVDASAGPDDAGPDRDASEVLDAATLPDAGSFDGAFVDAGAVTDAGIGTDAGDAGERCGDFVCDPGETDVTCPCDCSSCTTSDECGSLTPLCCIPCGGCGSSSQHCVTTVRCCG